MKISERNELDIQGAEEAFRLRELQTAVCSVSQLIGAESGAQRREQREGSGSAVVQHSTQLLD